MTVEELAMHRRISEVVMDAFAAGSMEDILASMLQCAVDVSPLRGRRENGHGSRN